MTDAITGTMKSRRPLRVALCGACLAGNMGGPALCISMVEAIRNIVGDVEVTLLSKYPDDEGDACKALGWRLAALPTKVQMFGGLPFSALFGALRSVGIPTRWIPRGPFSAYLDNDLLVDLSGISFSDHRPLSGLIINSMWLLPAMATGIPWVKASQAMGPFKKWWVRETARFFLPRASALIARGHDSACYLRNLLPDKQIYELPDVAFSLNPAPSSEVDAVLAREGVRPGEDYCAVGPSELVDRLASNAHGSGSYARTIAGITDELIRLSGGKVLLIPHARATSVTPHLDDINVCRKAAELVEHREQAIVLSGAHSAPVLKGVISQAQVAVGSRFHFIVAAVSSGVPSLAIAWGHKYSEMMSMLKQEDFVLGYGDLCDNSALEKVRELWKERIRIREEIANYLPDVVGMATDNARIILESTGKLNG